MDFDHTIGSNDNGGHEGGFGRKMEESFERAPANLEMYLGPKIPNASKTLEGIHVGLKFQFKMLRRW